MSKRFSAEELYWIRTNIPIRIVIERLLGITGKEIEGVYRFVCPQCHELQTAINPKTNLSRCFRCKENFNTIELVVKCREMPFVEAVKLIKSHFKQPLGKQDPVPCSCPTPQLMNANPGTS